MEAHLQYPIGEGTQAVSGRRRRGGRDLLFVARLVAQLRCKARGFRNEWQYLRVREDGWGWMISVRNPHKVMLPACAARRRTCSYARAENFAVETVKFSGELDREAAPLRSA